LPVPEVAGNRMKKVTGISMHAAISGIRIPTGLILKVTAARNARSRR